MTDNGEVFDTELAVEEWVELDSGEAKDEMQALYKSVSGRYYLEHIPHQVERLPWIETLSPEQAAAWLLKGGNNNGRTRQEVCAADRLH